MQLLHLEPAQRTKLFYYLCLGVGAVMLLTGKQKDPAVAAVAVLVAIAALYPLYLWLLGLSQGLPLWPVYTLVNGMLAALPLIQDPISLDRYSSAEIVAGGMTYVGFLVIGTVVWLAVSSRQPPIPTHVLMISSAHATRMLFVFVGAGIFYYWNAYFAWIPMPGNTHQIARGICVSLNTMGIFVLAFYTGRGLLKKFEVIAFVSLTVLSAAVMATTLVMNTASIPIAMAFLGYMLGSGKVPWKALAAAFLVLAVLHPGKYAMRNSYWGGEATYGPHELVGFYGQWFSYGLQELGGWTGVARGPAEDSEVTGIFERAGIVHMLLRVQQMSPDQVPYLNGITYEFIPRLLVPRFINSEKGVPHAANQMLTLNYGVQEAYSMGSTSIAWGLIAEAYANFGYLGVASLAVLLALFYTYFARLTFGVPMTSLRFVLGLLVMGASVKSDTMALFVTSQFQAVLGVSFAALFLMRRQPNPFYEAEAGTVRGRGLWGMGPAAEGGIRKTNGTVADDGMPAFGALASLIEGAPDRQSSRSVANAVQGPTGPRDVGTGGVVRAQPPRAPKRITRWMPRRVRAAVAARHAAEAGGEDQDVKPQGEAGQKERARPQQLGVPYQNYRRYRG